MKSEFDVWLAVCAGIVIGAMAHFGRLMSDNNMPEPKAVLGFLMQLGLVALLAATAVEQFQIKSSLMQALTAAIFAIAANELVTWLKQRAVKMAERMVDK